MDGLVSDPTSFCSKAQNCSPEFYVAAWYFRRAGSEKLPPDHGLFEWDEVCDYVSNYENLEEHLRYQTWRACIDAQVQRSRLFFPRRELRSEQGKFTITVENLPPGKADRVDFDLGSGEAIVSNSETAWRKEISEPWLLRFSHLLLGLTDIQRKLVWAVRVPIPRSLQRVVDPENYSPVVTPGRDNARPLYAPDFRWFRSVNRKIKQQGRVNYGKVEDYGSVRYYELGRDADLVWEQWDILTSGFPGEDRTSQVPN